MKYTPAEQAFLRKLQLASTIAMVLVALIVASASLVELPQ